MSLDMYLIIIIFFSLISIGIIILFLIKFRTTRKGSTSIYDHSQTKDESAPFSSIPDFSSPPINNIQPPIPNNKQSAITFCTNCKAQLQAYTKFCPYCGTQISIKE